ncbi:MAG TPA: peroxiredoxin [Caulobacteraceae bacterium]|nr:peroxiredoxin [Caulobacteraceae bacterium]
MMKTTVSALAAAAALAASPALAALPAGAHAPSFDTTASMAGKSFDFNLDKALRKGPVVLYFFPAAFTTGCTIEAHDFADASDAYRRMGATIIGVTAGNTDRLVEFSTSECRSKFAVAADPNLAIAKSYDTVFAEFPGHTNRTSFVITPDHKVLFVYSNLDPSQHVQQTMDALKAWRSSHPQ